MRPPRDSRLPTEAPSCAGSGQLHGGNDHGARNIAEPARPERYRRVQRPGSPGTQLTLPAVTSYTGSINHTTNLQATGTGSLLSLPELASITGDAGDCCSSTQFQALAGGDLELAGLTQISGPAVWLESDGAAARSTHQP